MTIFNSPSGIYIHVPFCIGKCRYCDFYSIDQLNRIPDYVAALQNEMALVHSNAGPDLPGADTLYFGGGTPSLLPLPALASLVDQAVFLWDLSADAEITMEANPATLGTQALDTLRGIGINRLNIGVQSLFQENLSFLGRIHSAFQAREAVEAARRAGFKNLGIDMIYGLPGQSVSQWEKDLQQSIALGPDHLSCYILSFEPGTPMHSDLLSGRINRLDDAVVAEQFRLTHHLLTDTGYRHYEISNFARQGHISRHNRKYWNHNEYLGLGPAAHSYRHPKRWWNHRHLEDFLEIVKQGGLPIEGEECLDATQQLIEALYLGLRQDQGIDLDRLERDFPHRFENVFYTYLKNLCRQGHMIEDTRRYHLTVEGMLLSDGITRQLVELLC